MLEKISFVKFINGMKSNKLANTIKKIFLSLKSNENISFKLLNKDIRRQEKEISQGFYINYD